MASSEEIDGSSIGLPGKKFRLVPMKGKADAYMLLPLKRSRKASPVYETVSKVTGYSVQDLKPEHEFQRDLGIDHLKQERIAQQLCRKLALDSAIGKQLAGCKSLNDALKLLEGSEEPAQVSAMPNARATQGTSRTFVGVKVWTEEALTEFILKVAREKTGYSEEVLTLDAQLEMELGIDSIKQAQIAGELAKHCTISFRDGLRIKDFPTLRHWLKFILQEQHTQKNPAAGPSQERMRLVRQVARRESQAESGLPLLPSTGLQSLQGGRFLLVDGGLAIGNSLREHILAQGADSATLIQNNVLPDFNSEEVASISLVHLGLLSVKEDPWEEHEKWVIGLLTLIQKLQKHLKSVFLVRGLSDDTELGIDGAFSGFARTLSKELPDTQVRMIEVNRSETSLDPEKLAACLALGVGDPSSSLELSPKETMSTLDLTQEPVLNLTEKSVILISGGMGGVGLEIAKDLVKTFHLIVVLLGRTHETDPNLKSQLEALSPFEGRMFYKSCDVTDPFAVGKMGEWVESQWGPITGIIHAAGILEDRRLELKTKESFRRVYAVKVQGFKNLADLATSSKAEFLCAFTSVSGRFGNAGQVDYSSANAAVAAMISGLRRRSAENSPMRIFAVAWGPWDEVGMWARTGSNELLQGSGQGVISPKEGVLAFRNELIFGAGGKAGRDSVSEVLWQKTTDLKNSHSASDDMRSKFCFLSEIELLELGYEISASHPFQLENETWLRDHVISGVAVLPATFGIEMMAQAALALLPGFLLKEMREFKIHHPVIISEGQATRVRVRAQAAAHPNPDTREVQVRLETGEGDLALVYEGIFLVSHVVNESPKANPDPTQSKTWDSRPIYAEAPEGIPLGSAFHVLSHYHEGKGRVGQSGLSAGHYQSLPIAREAAFHVCALMEMRDSKQTLIPKALQRLKYYRTEPEEGLTLQVTRKEGFTFAFQMLSETGELVAEAEGLEMTPLTRRQESTRQPEKEGVPHELPPISP